MYIKSLSGASLSLLLTATLLTASCRKKETPVDDGLGINIALAEKTFRDVQSIADLAAGTGAGAPMLSTCATVSHDTTGATRFLTVDYGPASCLCSDGIYRKGRIIVEYTGPYNEPGVMHTITFVDYFVNRNEVQGTKNVQYRGLNGQGQPYYDVTEEGKIILENGGGTINWLAGRSRTWKEGAGTATPDDDVFSLEGSAVLTTNGGMSYNFDITSPLVFGLSCRWIRSGALAISAEGAATSRTLNYGTGTCDALATYTREGSAYTINMR